MKILLFLFLFCINSTTHAIDYINVNIGSYHFNRDKIYNESNLGIGIEQEKYSAGIYYNSFYKPSVYLARNYMKTLNDSVAIGVFVGGVTGYKKYPVLPAIGLKSKIKLNKTTVLNLLLTPPVKNTMSGLIGFQLGFKYE